MDPVPGELAIGDHLAGYRLDEIIARGGMAVVYRAFDERLGRSVALKVLAAPLARDEAFRRRFIREARVAAAVDHPNIVPIFEAGDAVLARALAKSPGDRYPSCLEFAAALRRACEPGAAGPVPPRHDQAPESAAAPPPPSPPGGVPRSRRSRAVVLVTGVALLAVLGGGYLLFGGGSAGTGAAAALTVPGCTNGAASAVLQNVADHPVKTGGKPFDVVVTANGYGFVSLTTALAVIRADGPRPSLIRTIPVGSALGEALTRNQRYLLVAGDSGLTVFSVTALEHGLSARVVSLTSPGRHAVQVAVSPDDRYAFVSLQYSRHVAVFNLQEALTAGSGRGDLVGQIPVAANPIGLTVSPDGRYLYVASGLATPTRDSGRGTLNVIGLRKAETSPASAVLSRASAGCGPDRVAVSASGGAATLAVIDVLRALARKPSLTGFLPAASTPRQFALARDSTLLVADTGAGLLQAGSMGQLP